jgi:hypothetical protein
MHVSKRRDRIYKFISTGRSACFPTSLSACPLINTLVNNMDRTSDLLELISPMAELIPVVGSIARPMLEMIIKILKYAQV